MEALLERFCYSVMGTFGILKVFLGDHVIFQCFTVERPWADNKRMESCVPCGRYALVPAVHHISTPDPDDDYDVYEISGVSERSAIHIHIANKASDVFGCVGLGTDLGALRGTWAVLNSKRAFNEFMEVMEDAINPHLTIINYRGGRL